MNRKQRRAALKQAPTAGPGRPGDTAEQLFAEAQQAQQQQRLDDAARAYRRLIQLKPDNAQAINNLAVVLQAQGKLSEASQQFARALVLVPQLLTEFGAICATLCALLPPLADAMRQADAAWPARLSLDRLLGGARLAALADDPLFNTVLQSTPVRDLALERALTSLRAALLEQAGAGAPADDSALAMACALARQCFINEYVFATTPEEDARIETLNGKWPDVTPIQLASLAMYAPLNTLPGAPSLLDRQWPRALDEVLTQQLREPNEERALRDSIPHLTAIDDEVSQRVRQQYEENPYPRWANAPGPGEPLTLAHYLHAMMPSAVFAQLDEARGFEVLVAGCGTGLLPIELARILPGAELLAVDLSLSSLAYAKRKTPPDLAGRLSYAQADILKIEAIGRSFDIIDASGVLHHMRDPAAGLRKLVPLLRPGGLMHLGLYSELARRDITAARQYVAEKGYGASPADIRRARQDIMNTALRAVARRNDFFSTSECRDMLFHVQEHQLTIPQLKAMLAGTGLRFIGFAFDPARARHYAAQFAQSGRSPTDLDAWHAFETQNPDTFAGMYQFWVQKQPA